MKKGFKVKKIALISCSKSKKTYPCKANELYSESHRFKKAYAYAKITCDSIYILSAKYGLLSESDVIGPYNLTLNNQSKDYKKKWSNFIIEQLKQVCDIQNTEFVIIAGKNYYEYLLEQLRYTRIPLKGLSQGKGLSELNKLLISVNQNSSFEKNEESVTANLIHSYINSLRAYQASEINSIPFNNGIYFIMSKSIKLSGVDRIMRIGTHTSDDNLIKRLKQHYQLKHQRSSIFRKNIGRCLLNKDSDSYLEIWNSDRNNTLIDKERERQIENDITDYLTNNTYIICIEVKSKEDRLKYEGGLISSLHIDRKFDLPKQWLGLYSPKKEIRQSGLWCVMGLKDPPLTDKEFERINDLNNEYYTEINNQIKVKSIIKKNKVAGIRTAEVVVYLKGILEEAKANDISYIDIRSGNIAKELNSNNRMPTICVAMRKIMSNQDVVIETPPKGNGSNFVIRYKM